MEPVTPTGCCPPFDPAPYQDAEWNWDAKPFVTDHVTSFLHIPLDMGRMVRRNMALIEAAGAEAIPHLMLSDERSPWGSEVYIDVKGPVPGARMATLSGCFRSRVYDGPFKDAPQWEADLRKRLAAAGERPGQVYFAYTTCPACARAYGHNYVVLFARVGDARTDGAVDAAAPGNG